MPDYKNRDEYIKQAKQRMVKGATAKFKMPKSFKKHDTPASQTVENLQKERKYALSKHARSLGSPQRKVAAFGPEQFAKPTQRGAPKTNLEGATHVAALQRLIPHGEFAPDRAGIEYPRRQPRGKRALLKTPMKQQIRRRKLTKKPESSRD